MKKIYFNAKFDGFDAPETNSVLLSDDRIVYCGRKEEVLFQKDSETKQVDLNCKKILPAAYIFQKTLYQKNAKNNNFESKLCVFHKNIKNLEEKCIKNGVATVVYILQDEGEFEDLKLLAEEHKIRIDFLCFVDIVKCKKVMDENCSSFHNYKNHLKIGGYFLQVDGAHETHEAWVKKKYRGTQNSFGYPLVNEKHIEHYLKSAFSDKKQIIVEANGDRSVDLVLDVFKRLKQDKKFEDAKLVIEHNGLLSGKLIKEFSKNGVGLLRLEKEKLRGFLKGHFENNMLKKLLKRGIKYLISFEDIYCYADIFMADKNKNNSQKLNSISVIPSELFCDFEKGSIEAGKVATFCIVGDDISLIVNGNEIKVD